MTAFISWLISLIGSSVFMVSYVTGSSSFLKPLSAEEEAKYIEAYQNGDTTAKISSLNTIFALWLILPKNIH